MKQLILFINMVLFACMLMAQDPAYPPAPPAPQNIVRAEYFIDTDPGFGNGVTISITPGVDINSLAVSVNTTGLSNGVHRLWIRTRNNEGSWSVTTVREFIVDFDPAYPTVTVPQNIVRAEYFLDADPGIGNGTAITITPAVDINNLVAGINTTGLSNGIHRLYIRSRNNEGSWSITNQKDFNVDFDPAYPTVTVLQNIVRAEYFIDTDPGIGNGTSITITPAVDINNLITGINTTGLSNGIHRLYIRSRNNEGGWSITNNKDFIVDNDPVYPAAPAAPQNIVQAEYFINTDPGIGNGTSITITPAVDINNLVAGINTSALTPGTTNRLYLRTRNNEGNWSITNIGTFVVDIVSDPVYPSPPPAPQNIVQAEYFLNTDPGIGNGTAITITPALDINNLALSVNTSALSPGTTNRLYLRSRNNEGRWSITNIATFVVDIVSDPVYPSPPPAPQNIVQAEYFLNTDPGIGNGTAIAITPALDINNLALSVNTSALSPGTTNRLYLRSRNNEGGWSITNIATFVVDIVNDPAYPPAPPAPGNITYAEYFFDTDPGFGNGTPIAITPGVDINNLVVSTNVAALSLGNHKLFVRSLDDWSITSVQTFLKGNALPLNLLSFSAVGNRNDVLLTWETDNEVNTSHFDVEFSKDGTSYEKIAEVKAFNTPGTHRYSFVHVSPAGRVLFYRIRQVDQDGKFEYSKTARVNMSRTGQVILTPNPAQNFALLLFSKPSAKTNMQVYNSKGELVLQQQLNEGTMQHSIDVSKLAAGVYMLRLQTHTGVETFRLVKTN